MSTAASVATTASALGRFGSVNLSPTVAAVRAVIKNPTSNLTFSLLLLAGVTLAVLLVVTLLLAFLTPGRKKTVKRRRYVGTAEEIAAAREAAHAAAREREAAASASRAAARARGSKRSPLARFLAGPAFLAILLAVTLLAGYAATSTNIYCAKTCHTKSPGAKTASAVGHASCTSCHEANVVSGVVGNSLSRLRMIVAQVSGEATVTSAIVVDSRSCLHCHRGITSRTIVSATGTRMSHKEVTSAGIPCTKCHAGIGHTKRSYTLTMSGCVTCHDSKTASAECSSCHEKDPLAARFVTDESTDTVGSGDVAYPAVRAASRRCGGCHDQKKCDACHGIRMPHSTAFKEGGHARYAAFEGKLVCWRCHDPQVCAGDCHGSFGASGRSNHGAPAGWRVEHQAAAWDSGCVCHSGHSRRDYPICFRCHAKDHSVLPLQP